MSVISKLASSLDRRDEVPNQELAKQIATKKDKKAVQELVENLNNKSKDIQNDCIKVLYEIGEINPALVADYAKEFISLLDHKNNRLQWEQWQLLIQSLLSRIYKSPPKSSNVSH